MTDADSPDSPDTPETRATPTQRDGAEALPALGRAAKACPH